MKRLLAAAAILFALTPSAARAYKYTDCGSHNCRWPGFPVSFLLSTSLNDLFDGAPRVAEESVVRWNYCNQTFCEIEFKSDGTTDIKSSSADKSNVVFAQFSGWPHGPETLAVTTCFYRANGVIVDCDIAINAQDWKWSDARPTGNTMNLRDTVTHEAGHFWGLDHSDNPDSTMWATYDEKTIAADLDEDDIRAAWDAYCQGELPADDGQEQNDSLFRLKELPEGGTLTGLLLYDKDVWSFHTETGRFPRIEIKDGQADRHKLVSLCTGTPSNPTQLGVSHCIGDCVVAPTQIPVTTVVYYLMVETDFDCSPISAETYDLSVTQVESVSPGELTDESAPCDKVLECSPSDDDANNGGGGSGKDNGKACWCGIAEGGEGDMGFAGVCVIGVAGLLMLRRRRAL